MAGRSRAGLAVANADLAPIVEAEAVRIRQVGLLQRWMELRRDLQHAADAGVDASEIRWKWADLFAELIAEPGIEGYLKNERLWVLLDRDLDRYHRYLDRQPRPELPQTPGGP